MPSLRRLVDDHFMTHRHIRFVDLQMIILNFIFVSIALCCSILFGFSIELFQSRIGIMQSKPRGSRPVDFAAKKYPDPVLTSFVSQDKIDLE